MTKYKDKLKYPNCSANSSPKKILSKVKVKEKNKLSELFLLLFLTKSSKCQPSVNFQLKKLKYLN